MKKHGLFGLIFILFALAGCTTINSSKTSDALRETWMPRVNTNPNLWTRNADSWFFTGNPNDLQRRSSNAPMATAMTMMTVKVPQFTAVDVGGNFQVQIVGGQKQNSVYLLGPQAETRAISVTVTNKTLFVHQSPDVQEPTNDVILRIGVKNLQQLNYAGNGDVSGRFITSDGLTIHSCGTGTVLIDGRSARLINVTQTGSGTVTVLGTHSPLIDVTDMGDGDINISGRVGISHLVNSGNGKVSIIGADSADLTVESSGRSLTTVFGYVNLRRLSVENKSSAYIYWVNSPNLTLNEKDHGCVGLAGSAQNLNVNMTQTSQFAGQYLHGGSVYIHTYNNAHAIITACDRLFAAADGQSSIYYFGLPASVSKFTNQQGVILQVQPILPIPTKS